MIDTHSHPYLSEFEGNGESAVMRAIEAGVDHIILPNVDASTIESMGRLHSIFPAQTSMALGLHPTEVTHGWESIVDEMERRLSSGGYVAVGEVGIDLYWDTKCRDAQIEAFRRQLMIASRLRLPVIIHCREGLQEVLDSIETVSPDVPLVFHSFTGNVDDVRKIRQVCNPVFGINGVVTFKNAEPLRTALPEIGLGHIVLETDAPYLAPVPYRGKRNEPAYVVATCNKIADVLGVSAQEVESTTDSNARNVFNI